MKQTLNIKSCYRFSITIPNEVTVKTQILLCSSWSTIPTLKLKTQLASMWSISCNIKHFAQQQRQLTIQWSMLRWRTCCQIWWVFTAAQPSSPVHNMIMRMTAIASCRQNRPEHWQHGTAYIVKSPFRRRKVKNCTFLATKRNRYR